MVITDSAGQRHANGLRFALRDEAEVYLAKQIGDGVSGEVIACDGEEANVQLSGNTIYFDHGDCVLRNFHPVSGDALDIPADELHPEHPAINNTEAA